MYVHCMYYGYVKRERERESARKKKKDARAGKHIGVQIERDETRREEAGSVRSRWEKKKEIHQIIPLVLIKEYVLDAML